MDDALTAAAAPAATQTTSFEFRATGGEYFRIWIVNLLLTILTLGIYSAWAKVRRLRYLYGSTSLAGSAFEYHGQPLQILKGRLIAVGTLFLYGFVTQNWPLTSLLLLPVMVFLLPFVIVLSRRFQMRMTSWRGIRFGFHGEYGGALAAYIGWGVVAAITLYLLLPLWIYKRVRFLLGNSSVGTERFAFETGVGRYFAFYYITLGLAIAALLCLVLLSGGIAAVVTTPGGTPSAPSAIGAGLALVIGLILVPLAIGAYWERSFTNATFAGLRIGPHRVNCHIRMGRLLWLYVTNVLGVLLTLGLFYPWALVRRLRYQLECMNVEIAGSIDNFAAAAAPEASATGEAIGEVFDVDFGL
ncbi:MAG: rane protein [Steroidobacteraceae bacterium]|nr:rane protein [Steroidobacteraceae bacterium]